MEIKKCHTIFECVRLTLLNAKHLQWIHPYIVFSSNQGLDHDYISLDSCFTFLQDVEISRGI